MATRMGKVILLAGLVLVGGCASHETASTTAARRSTGVQLLPDPATATTRIQAVLDDASLNPDQCRFEWKRNGSVIAGAAGNGLDPWEFASGDEITVTVSLPGAGGAARTAEASVPVMNTPPTLTRVTLGLENGGGEPSLASFVEFVDPDRDTPAFDYRWYRNGSPIAGEEKQSLPVSKVSPGDQVTVEVVAHDAAGRSLPLRSDPFSLDNRAPQFSSQPAAPRVADAEFRYQAAANDPDGDTLTFELVSGPEGMMVDPGGQVSWTLPSGDARTGDFPVRIRATDSKGGQATQEFTIHLGPAS